MAGDEEKENPPAETPSQEEDDDAPKADDEDTGAAVAPIVKLEEVAVSTGEEDEDVLFDMCVLIAYIAAPCKTAFTRLRWNAWLGFIRDIPQSDGYRRLRTSLN